MAGFDVPFSVDERDKEVIVSEALMVSSNTWRHLLASLAGGDRFEDFTRQGDCAARSVESSDSCG